jgi:hypothetical protein
MKKPIFKHDCDKCKFIRIDKYNGKLSDFYSCRENLIIRHSDVPNDYASLRINTLENLLLVLGLK